LTVADYANQRKELVAKHFVLATGGIENARLLLNSAALTKHGVIVKDGMVGRGFMDHLNVDMGTFVLRDAKGTDDLQYFTTDEFVKKHQIGKGNVSFGIVKEVQSYGRTAEVKNFFKNLACSMGVADKVRFISDFRCPGDGSIGTMLEQQPDRRSRITLAEEKDALGLRKAVMHWDINEADLQSIRTIAMEVAKRFADSGLGYVKLNKKLFGDPGALDIGYHSHHMVTTRMATSPNEGVVDANCRVFGTENLFIAGSSIFSTGGATNPTMPLVQFALRLVDHLVKLG
jgi:choline dehydrogenase-like flavoprotein